MTLIQTIQERLAKICEELGHGEYAYAVDQCVVAIRAADLSDLEPKEGKTPRTDAFQKEYDENSLTNGDVEILDFARQLERELAALTARLEAKEAECEALRRDAERFEWCLPILTAQGDLGDARALALAAKFLKGLDGRVAIDAAKEQP